MPNFRIPYLGLLTLGVLAATAYLGPNVFYATFVGLAIVSFIKTEYSLSLLFLSGPLKTSPFIEDFPVDITLLFSILFFLDFIRGLNRHHSKNVQIASFFLLLIFAYVCISYFITPAPASYALRSSANILLFYIPLSLLILYYNPRRTEPLINGFINSTQIICAAWVGIGLHNQLFGIEVFQLDAPDYPVSHMSSFGEDYMVFSSFVVLLFTFSYIDLLYRRRNTVLNLTLLLAYSYMAINSPARGLTVALVISLLCITAPLFLRIGVKKVTLLASLTLLLAIVLSLWASKPSSESQKASIERLTNFSLQSNSIQERVISIKIGYEEWINNLGSIFFGAGIDAVASLRGDPGFYIHNLILEFLFEYGIIGFIPLFTFFYLISPWCAYQVGKKAIEDANYPRLWIVSVFIIFLIFSMFSNTLSNMRPHWIFSSLIILLSVRLSPKQQETLK